MKSERGDERAAKSAPVRRHHEVSEMREIEAAQDREQQQEQRRDAGKAQQVEIARGDAGKRTPAAQCGRRNEESGDGEEYLNGELAIPHKRGNQLGGNPPGVGHLRNLQSHVNVVHQHEEDGEATEQVHAVQALPVACGICGN